MRCKIEGCSGEVDMGDPIPSIISFGVGSPVDVFSCDECEALYDKNGSIIDASVSKLPN